MLDEDGASIPGLYAAGTDMASADVLDGLRATGAGWQSRIDVALREWLAAQR